MGNYIVKRRLWVVSEQEVEADNMEDAIDKTKMYPDNFKETSMDLEYTARVK